MLAGYHWLAGYLARAANNGAALLPSQPPPASCPCRFLYLFIGCIFWLLGTTPLLVSSLTVLILLAMSDVLVVPADSRQRGRRGVRAPQVEAEVAPYPVSWRQL